MICSSTHSPPREDLYTPASLQGLILRHSPGHWCCGCDRLQAHPVNGQRHHQSGRGSAFTGAKASVSPDIGIREGEGFSGITASPDRTSTAFPG